MMILKLIRELVQNQGLTVLLTLHDPNLALLFADRVALLDEGRLMAPGPPLKSCFLRPWPHFTASRWRR